LKCLHKSLAWGRSSCGANHTGLSLVAVARMPAGSRTWLCTVHGLGLGDGTVLSLEDSSYCGTGPMQACLVYEASCMRCVGQRMLLVYQICNLQADCCEVLLHGMSTSLQPAAHPCSRLHLDRGCGAMSRVQLRAACTDKEIPDAGRYHIIRLVNNR
jgi:hypothetical protein